MAQFGQEIWALLASSFLFGGGIGFAIARYRGEKKLSEFGKAQAAEARIKALAKSRGDDGAPVSEDPIIGVQRELSAAQNMIEDSREEDDAVERALKELDDAVNRAVAKVEQVASQLPQN